MALSLLFPILRRSSSKLIGLVNGDVQGWFAPGEAGRRYGDVDRAVLARGHAFPKCGPPVSSVDLPPFGPLGVQACGAGIHEFPVRDDGYQGADDAEQRGVEPGFSSVVRSNQDMCVPLIASTNFPSASSSHQEGGSLSPGMRNFTPA